MAMTWNPADKNASITLSGGNLTATMAAAGAWGGVRATPALGSGKVFFSTTIGNVGVGPGGGPTIGFANASAVLNNYIGSDNNGVGYIATSGGVYRNGASLATIFTATTADVIDVAIDFPNLTIWFRKNGGNWNNSGTADPATNTEGISFAGVAAGAYYAALGNYNSAAVTGNFGATAFTYAMPSGFSAPDIVALTATALTTASPSLGAPALSQVHALVGTALTTAVPVLGSPVFNIHLAATGIATAAPVFGTARISPWFGLPATAETWTQIAP